MSNFKVGDVVRLKSGGPKMTISKVYNEMVEATWFLNDIPKVYDFYVNTLEIDDEDDDVIID
ncbi:YodC family protein [Flavobacterium noncentrifugens]|uniref:Uncharacterized conserved protein YodC, DUF2158 family n=1 Tax=Flavobacterium noncentrifugens TaxID=1128970 RepID=A0A1G8XQB9_9FLAO|nr:DUF2158 domain-containing protein [Flavobacterium noncentrifugens]SDJ92791.1 Uncharacterized conserved protein YodC, DUF2158 family [Flavobacterium noncentrifugens]